MLAPRLQRSSKYLRNLAPPFEHRPVQEAVSTTFVGTLLSHGYADPRRLFADVFREWSDLNAWDLCDEYATYESLAQGPEVEGKGD